MNKMILYLVAVLLTAFITVICVIFAGAQTQDEKNVKFLESYGWQVEGKAVEQEEVTIPQVFDDVYKSYNELQKQAGLNLETCRGKQAIRYTYIVKNYPQEIGEPVRANVLCVDGEVVAGDVMTVSLSGFMHSLNYPQ